MLTRRFLAYTVLATMILAGTPGATAMDESAASRWTDAMLRMYLGVWENPHPEKKLARIEYRSTMKTECAPICVAITVEEPGPKGPQAAENTAKAKAVADDPKAMEEAGKAKEALLKLLRENNALFEGRPDPKKLKDIPIKRDNPRDPHYFRWGAFEINVQKRTYGATIGGGAWMQSYSGRFSIDSSGNWTAAKPDITYFDRFGKDRFEKGRK